MAVEERTLLIVDDSAEDRTYVKRLLTSTHHYDWKFYEAETLRRGLDLSSKHDLHCIILDQRLPDGPGMGMLEQLRSSSGDLRIPVVLLTAVGDEMLAAGAMKAGALDYIPKRGLTGEVISHAIEQAIEKFGLIRQRQRSEEELRRTNEELKMFAQVIAHDLQTPLRTIAAMTQILEMKDDSHSDQETRNLRMFVKAGVRRMSDLIENLLQYASLDDHTQSALMPVDATESVTWAIQNLRAQIEASGASVTIQGNLPLVLADTQLRQVFQNLIGNAIKYQSRDRVPAVRLSAKADTDEWTIEISDNGIGFDMKHAERIFGLMQRLHSAEVYEGTGIGLAICKRIVQRYQGQLWVESVPGEGSTFYLKLPGVTVKSGLRQDSLKSNYEGAQNARSTVNG